MARIACRWPGGMTLAVHRAHGAPPLTERVNGPTGYAAPAAPARSRDTAAAVHKGVMDIARELTRTAGDDFGPRDYGVTTVSDAFWAEWQAQNAGLDVLTKRFVFEVR